MDNAEVRGREKRIGIYQLAYLVCDSCASLWLSYERNLQHSERGNMPTRTAEAEWKGNLAEGGGNLRLGSGAFSGPYTFKSRFEEGQSATNPEELIGAAHAGCFTMALTAALSRAGITPAGIHTKASVKLEKLGEAFSITRIDLNTEAEIPGIDDATFQKYANDAKQNCPISKALAGTEIHLTAKLN
jgi:lipoyl-dependent peroxiredoxin